MNNIMRNVLMRRSIYTFDDRPVRDEELLAVLEQGKQLSNAEDNHAWHFTVVQNRKLLDEVMAVISENALDARGIPDVPTIVVISSIKDTDYAVDAANMVFGSMMMVAEKRGIGSCWFSTAAGAFNTDKAKETTEKIGIPAQYKPVCVGAFGYKPTVDGNVNVLAKDNVINIVK